MDKSSSSVTVLLFLMNLPFFGHALFEYICNEKQLYKPYVQVYRTRRGEQILNAGPGFHDMTDLNSIYVCINGVVYMYFSKSTELGEVYETPQLKMFSHSCETYNVQPKEGSASIMEVQLHLRAILLLGDPNDYRRPAIQKFTAPYFFKKDQLNTKTDPKDPEYAPMSSMYLNASSLVIIGQSECTLLKGPDRNTMIKVRPHVFTPEPDEKVEVGYLCKIGFQPLLDKATTSKGVVPSEKDRSPALALINDEAIRVDRCQGSSMFDLEDSGQKFSIISQEVDELDNEYNKKKAEQLEAFQKLLDGVLNPLNEEKGRLEKKKGETNSTKVKEIKKLEKQIAKLDVRIKLEGEKKSAFEGALNALSEEVTSLESIRGEAKPDGEKGTAARADMEAATQAEQEYEKTRERPVGAAAPPQSEIDGKKDAFDAAAKKAKASARDYLWAMSNLEMGLVRLKKTVEKVKRLSAYTPSAINQKGNVKGKKNAVNFNPDGTMSVVIQSPQESCDKLPKLEGPDGECVKGKPDKAVTCNLFLCTLTAHAAWTDGDNKFWKKSILDFIADIFSVTCDRIPSVKKMTTVVNLAMAFYLNNESIFNKKPNLQTDTCLNYKTVKNLKILGAAGATTHLDYNDEDPFWNSVRLALTDCKRNVRRLSFREKAPGEYQFVRFPGTDKEMAHDIVRHQEQSDAEFSYNFVVDMNWKMFVTVMGYCMPEYEKKIPLITSRFFAMYTEAYLIPLRETWISPKDNVLYQFTLGEFYNEHTEMWADLCMEASFIYAGQREYRPPRSLLVNCASEHNYFVDNEHNPI